MVHFELETGRPLGRATETAPEPGSATALREGHTGMVKAIPTGGWKKQDAQAKAETSVRRA